MAGSWWAIRLLGDVRQHLTAFYGWFALAFAAYLAALWVIGRAEGLPAASRRGGWLLALILVGAAVCRASVLRTTPTLSDDIYRYRWDGRVQLAGFDPYAYPPDHPALAFLRDEPFTRINFPHLRTVYPPVTQWAFQLGARLGQTLVAQKIVLLVAELLLVIALLGALASRGRSLLWVAAYAWHPLAVLEIAGSGHNDVVGVAWLWLGVWAWCAGRRWAAGGAWALAFLSKYATALLAPWWWFRRQGRVALLAACALAAWPLICYPTVISALYESLSAMTMRFESNASVYLLLAWLAGDAGSARTVAAMLGAGFLLWWAWREPDPIRYLLGGFTAAVLLSPVLHPWYLLWIIPCFCFVRVPAIVALTGTVVLAYTVWPGRLADGRWMLPVWAHVLEYAPVAILGLWEVVRWLSRSFFLPATNPSLSARS